MKDKDALQVLLDYTASQNPQGFRKFLKENGENPRATPREARSIIMDNGEEGVVSLLQYHPDKDTILALFGRCTCQTKNVVTQVVYQPHVYWLGGGLVGLIVLLLLLNFFTKKTQDND